MPLRIRAVALLWGGLSFSAIGDQLYAVALSWVAVELLGANAGYLSALQALTLLLAGLSVGKWADGWTPRVAMIGADLTRAVVLLLMVSAWWLSGRPPAWMLVLAIVVLAVGQAVFQPALQAWLPTLVRPAQWLPAANGLFDATDRSARLIGPGLVALAAGSLPVMHFFTLDALSFLGSAAALMLIAPSRRSPLMPTSAEPGRLWQSVARGWMAIRQHPVLSYALASTGVNNGAWYATFFLGLPLLLAAPGAEGASLQGIGAYGLVIACYGCTNLASTVFFGSRALPAQPQFQMFGGNGLVGFGVVLMGLTPLLPAACRVPALAAAAALGAIGGPMKDIPLAVLRQTRIPHADRSSAMRAYLVMNSAGMLLAMVSASALIGAIGVPGFVVACGLVMVSTGGFGIVKLRSWREPR